MTPEQLLQKLTDYQTKYSDESLARNQDRLTLAQDRTIIASLNSRLGEIISESRTLLRNHKYALDLAKAERFKHYRNQPMKMSVKDVEMQVEIDFQKEEKEKVDLVSEIRKLEAFHDNIQEILNALSSQLRVLGADFNTKNY